MLATATFPLQSNGWILLTWLRRVCQNKQKTQVMVPPWLVDTFSLFHFTDNLSPSPPTHQTLTFPSNSFSFLSDNFDITGNYSGIGSLFTFKFIPLPKTYLSSPVIRQVLLPCSLHSLFCLLWTNAASVTSLTHKDTDTHTHTHTQTLN